MPEDKLLDSNSLSSIVRAAIHPAIGIARVGSSRTDCFIGPEVLDPPPVAPGSSRDATGALKRQAARFRVYGYNDKGEVVGELTAGEADIQWTVHVANKKAAWYQFAMALDIPEAAHLRVHRRNPQVRGAARRSLVLDPGPKSIGGREVKGEEWHLVAPGFGSSTEPVYLGELETDRDGRLVFLGGFGAAGSPEGKPLSRGDRADGWYDDTSDGPVTAKVRIGDRRVPVEPAWVVTGPPDFAPDIVSVRSLYDLLIDVYVQAGWLTAPQRVSFLRHIYPILSRLSSLQWVNKGFLDQFGWGGRYDFADRDYVRRLASPSSNWAELRRQVLHSFRSPQTQDNSPLPWPWVYGDAVSVPASDSPRQHIAVTPTQYDLLSRWAAGDFQEDWDPDYDPPHSLRSVPPARRPRTLDRAALERCLADAFHPGAELTWPMRHITLYRSPFRIRHRSAREPEPDYGSLLTPRIALKLGGPLHAQSAGDLTRWLLLPWQADTATCRSGYEPEFDPFLPTFWPAQVPNQVLTEKEYDAVRDTHLSREERLVAFSKRRQWTRSLKGSLLQQIGHMVAHFEEMGVVEQRPGVPGDPDFSRAMFVESSHPATAEGAEVEPTSPSREAGWESEDVREQFRSAL